jgi:cell division protein FtsB
MQRRRIRRGPPPSVLNQRKLIRGILVLIAVALLIIFFFGDHGLYQLYRLKMEQATTQRLISELREKRKDLQAEKSRLEVDLDYIERLARERYRMAKRGEKVFKVIERPEREK